MALWCRRRPGHQNPSPPHKLGKCQPQSLREEIQADDLVPGWQKQKETLVRLSICEINKTIVSSENDWETRFCYQAGSLTSSTSSLLPNIWKLFKLSFDSFEPFQVIWVNVKQKDIFRKAITCLEWWTGSPVSLKHSPVHSPPSDPFVSMQSTMFENIGQCHPNVDI